MTKSNLEELVLTYSSRRYPRTEDGRAARQGADRKSTDHILIHTQERRGERERESKKQRKATNPQCPPPGMHHLLRKHSQLETRYSNT